MSFRIHTVAKEIGVDRKELLKILQDRGYDVKTVSSTIDRITAESLREEFGKDWHATMASEFVPKQASKENVGNAKGSSSEWDQESTYIESISESGNINLDAVADNKPVIRYTSEGFELEVREFLMNNLKVGYSILSKWFLFMPLNMAKKAERSLGYEMDHLLHVRFKDKDAIVIIECKNQPITIEEFKGKVDWYAEYGGKRKSVVNQLRNHVQAILQSVNLKKDKQFEVICFAVSSIETTSSSETSVHIGGSKIRMIALSYNRFKQYMLDVYEDKNSQFCRIEQSDYLRQIRQGIPLPELGHPVIPDAISYIKRCRRTLDFTLFQSFSPTAHKWAINGSAGMGKSVLLAYTVAVLSTDYVIHMNEDGRKVLVQFKNNVDSIPSHSDRAIRVYSLNQKQLDILKYYWEYFILEYRKVDPSLPFKIVNPVFEIWSSDSLIDGNVCCIDEAHDLDLQSQHIISKWILSKTNKRYLVIACDRHQKLRLSKDDYGSRMIEGLSFSGSSKKLYRIYRNSFSVYVASISILFRWFAPRGPKIIPEKEILRNSFGFEVVYRSKKDGCNLKVKEDAHPANNWNYTLSSFPDNPTAFNWVKQYHFSKRDVLWVRFSEEDKLFNYELLNEHYTYHNLHTSESPDIIDKYIKGQEYPIVIIEGVPNGMNSKNQEVMLQSRREMYLCASRANCFLYLIYGEACSDDIKVELDNMLSNLSCHGNTRYPSKSWSAKFSFGDDLISFNEYDDIVGSNN